MSGFPNVPIAPGVPPLLRAPDFLGAGDQFLSEDLVSFDAQLPEWGIFLDGQAVIEAESTLSFDYKQSWAIANFPIEQGGFETYDKVDTPFDARIQFASGASDEARTLLLQSVAAVAKSLDVYDVVTPEVTYQNVNVSHYDYRRTSRQGVGLLQVAVWLVEIRQNVTATFSKVKSPSAAATTDSGPVQTSDTSAPLKITVTKGTQ